MPRPISTVERLYGDRPEPETKEFESRWSMTYGSETPGKFEGRPRQLIRPQSALSVIEARRQDPVPDLREFVHTDKPEAEESKMAEKYMKESTEPNEVAQFQSRLETIERDAAEERRLHLLQVTSLLSTLESVVKQSKPDTVKDMTSTRAMLDNKVPIKAIMRATPVQAENSLYHFKGALKQMELFRLVEGEVEGSIEEENRLNRAVLRWVGDDERILSSIRTKLGQEGKGTDLFEHVLTYYIEAMVGDTSDAEKQFQLFDWKAVFGGNEEKMHEGFDEFTNIVSHLSRSRQGEPAEWVDYISERVPDDLNVVYDRYIRKLAAREQRKASEDITTFALYLGKALKKLNASKPVVTENVPMLQNYAHQHFEGAVRDKGCNKCKLFGCPMGYDDKKECDIFGTPTVERVKKISEMEKYKAKVDNYRKVEKQSALDYVALSTNAHEVDGLGLSQSLLDGFPEEDFVGVAERLASLGAELREQGNIGM